MSLPVIPIWKKAPLLRLIIPFMLGICWQDYVHSKPALLIPILATSILLVILLPLLPIYFRYKLSSLTGTFIFLLLFALGSILTWMQDIRNDPLFIGKYYSPTSALCVSLEEEPVVREKTTKAIGRIQALIKEDGSVIRSRGKTLVYFLNDSLLPRLSYGNRIVFRKTLQDIPDAANPGGFDFQRYSLLQGITSQVFLRAGEFEILHEKRERPLQRFLYQCRDQVLLVLHRFIPDDAARGMAAALLIGYKDDLDRRMVQSYTNTGVVHIIAISGLHLGLIYGLLVGMLAPFKRLRRLRWLRAALILCPLWIFSLLAGGQPSVLRSALMFSCIIAGEAMARKSSIYNTLGLSAFLLLCFNPFWLWDIGFQLSYAALLSIVVFNRTIYNWIYFRNKLVDGIWKLNAVTLSAQILTTPLCIYHFHQFPNYFLLTNLVAVPLSSMILLCEILLCCIPYLPSLAMLLGSCITWMIGLMNAYVQRIERLPFAIWDNLQLSLLQVGLLYFAIAAFSLALLEKVRLAMITGLFAIFLCCILRSISFYDGAQQRLLILYNVPKRRVIDLVTGRRFDCLQSPAPPSADKADGQLQPTRTRYRLRNASSTRVFGKGISCFQFGNKRIVIVDSIRSLPRLAPRIRIDLLIIGGYPFPATLHPLDCFEPARIVLDPMVPRWKALQWKNYCDSLSIPLHDVTVKGAFVMNCR